MESQNSIETNVRRILAHYGIADSIVVMSADPDRLWAWPSPGGDLLRLITQWPMDPKAAALHHHGTQFSFREPLVRPSMQVSMHIVPSKAEALAAGSDYFLEIDCDYFPPDIRNPISLFGHAGEVIYNAATRRLTDQNHVAALLDSRGVPHLA